MPDRRTCATCRFLVDDEKPAYRDYYVRCAWWDDRPLPVAGGWEQRRTASAWVTRKTAIFERGARLPECDTWEAP
jgi:hypothetical protein